MAAVTVCSDFEHYFARVWDECNYAVVWPFFGIGMKTDCFQSCGHCWASQICWHIEFCTLTAPPFRIWNRSAGVPSPLLTLFIVMLPSRWWSRRINIFKEMNIERKSLSNKNSIASKIILQKWRINWDILR